MINREKLKEVALNYYFSRTDESFNDLYKYFNPILINYVRRHFTLKSVEVKNISANFFFNFITKIDQFDIKRGEIGAWMFAILRNECLANWRRDTGRRGHRQFVTLDDYNFNYTGLFNDVDYKIEKEYKTSLIKKIHKRIYTMEEPFRSIMIDKHIFGFTIKEMMNIYNKNESFIKNKLFQGLNKLKKEFSDINKVKYQRVIKKLK
jgi:RNA polymerase sigma factor (sigma-70 family)